jgi:hypothetical protein
MPLIGWLGLGAYGPNSPMAAAFRQGLIGAGYIEGRNVAIDFRATTQFARVPQMVADLISRNVAVLVTSVPRQPSLLPSPQPRRFPSCLLSATTRGDTASLPI